MNKTLRNKVHAVKPYGIVFKIRYVSVTHWMRSRKKGLEGFPSMEYLLWMDSYWPSKQTHFTQVIIPNTLSAPYES